MAQSGGVSSFYSTSISQDSSFSPFEIIVLLLLSLIHDLFVFFFLMQAAGVDNTFRRKFDREEYLERARKREEEVRMKPLLKA